MTKDALISDRKDDHLRINLEEDVNSRLLNGFGRYRLRHQALPEINREDVDISTVFLGKRLKAPILVSSMTGGTRRAAYLNQVFAEAAQACGVAFGVGSQRAAIEHPEGPGTITSGTFSPTLNRAIAMGYLPASAEGEASLPMRGRHYDARILDLPFYKRAS